MIIFISNYHFLISQIDRCSSQSTQQVKTDPANAINDRYPSKVNNNGRILNWMDVKYKVYSQFLDPEVQEIYSPFYQANNIVINHFLNNKDFKPEDGWELLFRATGYDDNGNLDTDEDNAGVVLYNKFLGIIRVFSLVGNNHGDYNYANINLRFVDNPDNESITSLLDLAFSDKSKPLQSLSEFPSAGVTYNNLILSNITKFENNEKKWFYADFPVIYDPCTCIKRSKLWVEVCLIDSAKLNITGILEGELANISNKSSNNSSSKIDKSESSLTLAGIGKNIVETHKAFDKLNKDLSNHINALYANENDKKDEVLIKNTLLESLFKDGSFSKIYKAVPIVGDVLTFLDFFNGGGKNSGPQSVQLMPTSIKANLSINGSLVTTPTFQSYIFFNPGSNFLNYMQEDREYPLYDHILGTFNLLTSPKVKVNKTFSTNCYESSGNWHFDVFDTLNINLVEPINYVLNPAAFSIDTNDINILASIEFEIDFGSCDIDNTYLSGNGVRLISGNKYRTEYLPIQCLDDNYFQLVVNTSSTFHNPTNEDIIWHYCNSGYSCGGIFLKNFKIKLFNEYTRNDLLIYPKADKVVELRTYIPTVSWYNVSNDNEVVSFSDYPNSLTIDNQVISSDLIAWGDITIGDNVTTANNGNFTITSINGSINVLPGSTLSPNITLKLGFEAICNEPLYPPVSSSEINTFCQSNQAGNYRPSLRDLKPRRDDNELQGKGFSLIDSFSIYPNPTDDYLTIKTSSNSQSIDCKIFSLIGEYYELPINLISNGVFRVDVSSLAPGVYFVKISDKVEKFIKM